MKDRIDQQWIKDRKLEELLRASDFPEADAALELGAKIGWSELERAAAEGDAAKLSWLVDHGAATFMDGRKAPKGLTPMLQAVRSGHAPCVALLAKGRPHEALIPASTGRRL